jgi:hypothetical protein
MATTPTNDDLRTRLRGEPEVTPEDTRTELLQDLETQDLRGRLRGEPGVVPEDTRTELLERDEHLAEEHRQMLEKEERKAADAAAMRQEREARARAWTQEQARAEAAHDTADHGVLAAMGSRGESDAFYLRSDMAERAKASPLYDTALKQLAPEIHARVQDNEKDLVTVDLAANRGGSDKVTAAGADQAQPETVRRALDQQLEDEVRRRKAREQEQAGQGLNEVDVQRTGKELERGDFIVPRRITQAYTEVDGKFFAKESNRVMFEDKGEKLATSTTDKAAIADMVAYAKAKQWEALKLTGSQEFRREAWLQAESQGIKTQGYTPKQYDLSALETLRQERSTNAITPLQERRTERPILAASKEAAAPRHDLNKNQAVMHVEASKNVTTNMEALRKQPGMLDKSVEDLTRLAYLRGIVSEENKLQPKPVQDEALARFDKQAIDPQFLKRVAQETEPKIQEKTTERVQKRDTLEQSL